MHQRIVLGIVIGVVGAIIGTASLTADGPDTGLTVSARADRGEIVVTVGPIDIPASSSYAHHAGEAHMQFQWPVTGWLRGYRIDLIDADGRTLPRDMMHHAGVMNLDRRQLVYPLVERLLAAGQETRPVMLPESMGVPLAAGQKLLMYYALVNASTSDLKGVALKLTVTWTPESAKTPKSVFPVYLNANPKRTRSFDVPPGVSVTTSEIRLPASGRFRTMGAHLHDHAIEMRLEDAVTGKVLARIKTKREPDGRLISVSTTKFLLKLGGLRVKANHPYRVVAVYDNPTNETIFAGAMAFLVGAFIPDDVSTWPSVDPDDKLFKEDLAVLLGQASYAGHGHGGR